METGENFQLDEEPPVKNTLDEEFFNQSTFRTQERMETNDNELASSQGGYMSPEHMEGEFLRGQYYKEQ